MYGENINAVNYILLPADSLIYAIKIKKLLQKKIFPAKIYRNNTIAKQAGIDIGRVGRNGPLLSPKTKLLQWRNLIRIVTLTTLNY